MRVVVGSAILSLPRPVDATRSDLRPSFLLRVFSSYVILAFLSVVLSFLAIDEMRIDPFSDRRIPRIGNE